MEIIKLPYGNDFLSFPLQKPSKFDVLLPRDVSASSSDQKGKISTAIRHPLSGLEILEKITHDTRVAISINDKTRPVPNDLLLGCLLKELQHRGVPDGNITLFIASGTHVPMVPEEFPLILGNEIITKYKIEVHDCDDTDNLVNLGKTTNGTPVLMNKQFYESDLKIVVGDIELHHFAGYSGGVKSAAIGLAGRDTINTNHILLLDHDACVGKYEGNPLRMDIEEIGRMARVDLALNAVLSEERIIQRAFFGLPCDVMQAGIKVVNSNAQVPIHGRYDIVIASAGGYPKDINLYQSQKAMTHASLFCKPGGKIILVAECREGAGSAGYLHFMRDVKSVPEVIKKFQTVGFSVGPHKAFQIARLLENYDIYLISAMPAEIVRSLLLKPLDFLASSILDLIDREPHLSRIAFLPFATASIPVINNKGVRYGKT